MLYWQSASPFRRSLARVTTKTPPFRDVPPGHWAAKSVQQLKDEGILVGYPDERFRGALTPDAIHALTRSLVK